MRPSLCQSFVLFCGVLCLSAVLLLSVPAAAEENLDASISSATTEHDQTLAGTEQAETKKAGFPQLDSSSYPSQLFWLTIVFVLMLFSMSKIALPKVGAVIETRKKMNDDNLAVAASAQGHAEQLKAANDRNRLIALEQAQTSVAKAEQAANDKVNAELARFGDQARQRVAKAEQAIARAREEAMGSIADIAADAASDMAAKIGHLNINKADARKIVGQILQKEKA